MYFIVQFLRYKESKIITFRFAPLYPTHICKLVLEADEETRVKVHNVRKYASSCSLAQTMLIGELTNAIGWSSPVTFYKHYLSATEPLAVNVVLPVMNSCSEN